MQLSRANETSAALQHCRTLASLHLLHPAPARPQGSMCSSHAGSAARSVLSASLYCSPAACRGVSKPLHQRDTENCTLHMSCKHLMWGTAGQAPNNLSTGKQQRAQVTYTKVNATNAHLMIHCSQLAIPKIATKPATTPIMTALLLPLPPS